MPNEFVVKNGLIVSGTSDVSGNLLVRQSTDISGSLAVGLNLDTGTNSAAFGNVTTASGNVSFAHGSSSLASAIGAHAEGWNTVASGQYSHAEGLSTVASGAFSHARGRSTIALGNYSNVEGWLSTGSGEYTHAEGFQTHASGQFSHTEGNRTFAFGGYSHAEGSQTQTSGQYSHAEGTASIAFGDFSHTEGLFTSASGQGAHAEGSSTIASGENSHAEGQFTLASGIGSHAEGSSSVAFGVSSHAQGWGTIASGSYQGVVGQFNSASSTPLWILGDGLSASNRKNLVAAYRDNLTISGTLNVTGSSVATSVSTSTLTASNAVFTTAVVSGSFTVFTGSGIEFQVTDTGVRIGTALTDTHRLTGSLGITGSLRVFAGANTEFEVLDNGTRIGNLQADIHRVTGSFGITGSLNVVGGGITGSLLGTASVAISASVADSIPTSVLRQEVHVSVSGSDVTGNGSVVTPYRTLVNAIASGSTIYGAGNYVLFVHPGTYAATTIPNNTPLSLMGVQESRGSDVTILSLSMPSIFANTRDLALQNLKVDNLSITSGQVVLDGCNIGTVTDSANSAFGNFSGSYYHCNITTYQTNSDYRLKYFRGCNINSISINANTNVFADCTIYSYLAPSSQIQSHILRDTTIISDVQVRMYGDVSLSNTSILDTTGSRQSIDTNNLRYSDSIFDVNNSIYTTLTASLYGKIEANEITGSLFADFENLIYVSSGSGDDNNDGTYLRPKKTVAGALAIATSGTKIKIGPGIYREGAFLGTGNIALEGEYWNVTTNPSTGPQVYLAGTLNVSNAGYNEISNIKFDLTTGTTNAATIVTNNCICLGTFQFFNTGTTLHNNLRVLGNYSTAIGNTTQTINNSRFATIRNTATIAAAGRTTFAFNNCTFTSIPELIASGTYNFTNCSITSTNNTGSFHLNGPNSYTFSNSTLNNLNGTQARLAGAGQVTVDDFNFDVTSSTHTNRTSVLSAFDRVFAGSFTGSLSGTASWATNVAGAVETASFVTNLSQNVTITGSLTVITGSIILSPESTITGSTINQPTLVQAANTSGQSIGNNVVPAIIITNWTNLFTQNAAEWNATTGVFTATKAGVYLVSANLTYASVANTANGQQVNVSIRKNTTDQAVSMQITSAATTSLRSTGTATAVVSLDVGDTITIRTYHNLGNTATLASQSTVTIQQIASRVIH